jgi:hypothetical protein
MGRILGRTETRDNADGNIGGPLTKGSDVVGKSVIIKRLPLLVVEIQRWRGKTAIVAAIQNRAPTIESVPQICW